MPKDAANDSPDESVKKQHAVEENQLDAKSDESITDKKTQYVDQEMANEYGFTSQQAKEMSMYL